MQNRQQKNECDPRPQQPELFPADRAAISANLGLTFRDSKSLPVHGWYPYVEGFSASYIEDLIRQYSGDGIAYDPFGGSGTVNLIASNMGIRSAFSEANPFMRFVAETKINARNAARLDFSAFNEMVARFSSWANSPEFIQSCKDLDISGYELAFNGRDFFAENNLRELLALRDAARLIADGHPAFRDLLLLSIASVTVACSHMTRRADLRRRRSDEYLNRVVNVRKAVLDKLGIILRDIALTPLHQSSIEFASPDCRTAIPHLENSVGLVLTSPPYLNGTNYIRNTKLELWLLGFIQTERELSELNKVCMVCGINNVVRARAPRNVFDDVEQIAGMLRDVSPDFRIPEMVRGYFSDMYEVFMNCKLYLKANGKIVLDIGDSRFYGVNVPTDSILVSVAAQVGLRLEKQKLLARRHSRDKTPLKQVELVFTHDD
ncbi:hypothetical protein MK632_20190 [Rhizobium changzhiense]|uniref:hypothetical protein n=1 Tax=Rhizobium changzhiense TaxID=2692317 RepID=UPI001F0C2A78|nr:hypothetical protein [Rhizobium changzhiense]MCH4548061.1 hypothetical protein [Rhizobium changzhiense]